MAPPTFSIVISEKGGAERREGFEQTEVSIGRVKGNDVLLPKGNVSKRHARLIIRDGRFIVTDLKSTNGTYVNHRRISHATLVREGDRIYIGDFVLRIEADAPSVTTGSLIGGGIGGIGGTVFDGLADSSSTPQHISSSNNLLGATHAPAAAEVVSHFPIEHDPDELALDIDVPGPPRVPDAFREVAAATGPNPVLEDLSEVALAATPSRPPLPGSTIDPSSRNAGIEASEAARKVKQAYFAELMRRVEGQLDLDALDGDGESSDTLRGEVEEAAAREADALAGERPPPEGLSADALRAAAVEELMALGPLEELLADDHVREVRVVLGRVVVTRRGRESTYPGVGFSSERAIGRALKRLCATAVGAADGRPLADEIASESYLELLLPEDRTLFAVRPPAAPNGHLVVVRKLHADRPDLNELVRNGTISRGMASLLGHCVLGRANLLVAASHPRAAEGLVHALAGAARRPPGDTLWLTTRAAASAVPADAASLELASAPSDWPRTIEAAARLNPHHVVAPPMRGEGLVALLEAVTQGMQGVLLAVRAPTLRQAVDRLAVDVAATRTNMSPQTAREWIASAFDLGLEVARLRDDRTRVVRLAEFEHGRAAAGLRDVFTFAYHRTAAGGSVEGSFYASGTVPRVVEDLGARGMPLDASIFHRHPSS